MEFLDDSENVPATKRIVRSACDRCHSQKRACSRGKPCCNCRSANRTCVYSREWVHPDAGEEPPSTNLDAPSRETHHHISRSTGDQVLEVNAGSYSDMEADDLTELYQPTQLLFPPSYWPHVDVARPALYTVHNPTRTWLWGAGNQKSLTTFQFLANFTSTTGLANSFDCCSVEERSELLKSHHRSSLQTPTVVREASKPAKPTCTTQHPITNSLSFQQNHIWGYILDKPTLPTSEDSVLPKADIQAQYTQNWMMPKSRAKLPFESVNESRSPEKFTAVGGRTAVEQAALESQLLASTGLRIVSRIKEVTMVKPRNSIVDLNWTSHVEDACLEFFSSTNISRFLILFWAGWYPNWPTIHRPTFTLPETMDILVAAMVVIGKLRFMKAMRLY